MTISYLLAPEPKWILMDNVGEAAGGAKLYTYRSLNKTEKKTVYQDPGGTTPWTNPILFDLNGVQGPFYWSVDTDNLDDTYYLEVYDAQNNLLWTMDNFYPSGTGGGGGGTVTSYIQAINYITNNQFINHIDDKVGDIAPNNSLPTNLVIAPSNHKGFTPANNNPIVSMYGTVGPDIRFIKNNTNASDNISFPAFPLASFPLTGDVTPVDYVRYQCTNMPSNELFKNFQFPITQKVKNLSNTNMTFGIWAAVASVSNAIKIYMLQYFGSGTAASDPVKSLIGTANLTTTWNWYSFTFPVPSVGGKSLGTPGQTTNDDAIYIQVEMPLGEACDIFFTKPALFLGNVDPKLKFDAYDQIDAINQTPRTGDVRVSYWTSPPLGWVAMDDGSIGNVGSNATNRANQDTFQLYKTIYDAVSDAWAPVSGGRTGNAVNDFISGKTLTLPKALGRVLAESGLGSGLTQTVLGQNSGSENSSLILTGPNLPTGTPYNTNNGTGNFNTTFSGPGNVPGNNLGNAWSFGTSTGVSISRMQPATYMNFFIKL